MIFDILFYASVSICIVGTCYKVIDWTKKSVANQPSPSFFHRFSSLIKGVAATVFSHNIIGLFQSFFIDVLFQGRILKTSLLRWAMHFLIFSGFMALLFMHALDKVFIEQIFPWYYPTVNPFFFLRNLFGFMVLAGVGIAVYRRYIQIPARLKNARADFIAILLIFFIILSGIILEGVKMTSVSEFSTMVEDYAGLEYEDEDTLALETYWVKDFALVSARVKPPFEQDVLDQGFQLHETSCVDCHSPNTSAFMGYAVAKIISPFALFLDKFNAVTFFYYVHILACFTGLALVPFSKMFHMIATPVSLMTNAVEKKHGPKDRNLLTKQLMELDACTHCSTCNLNCSAGMMYESIKNDYILPSEKMQVLKKAVGKKQLTAKELKALYQGLYICTNCDRCTVVCPSGINLKSLWRNVRENFIQQSPDVPFILSTFSFVRGLNPGNIEKEVYAEPLAAAFKKTISIPEKTKPLKINARADGVNFTIDLPLVDTFSHCFGCQNCSTICPVVACFKTPEEELTLLPHQIMYSLGLGLVDMAQGSAMLWNCLSCYQCQENCPQNVTVCDILFQLKNKTFKNLQDID
ncbi:MAG: 4Fe-4S dicluster domain-containing protein [Proteobacteria bacterium]|nr:4Fe-4S dicluster domain-containing protein [Pseudomonadota bacterium]MBU1585458.1 4Fe-4S dicluster domain-containing protein [Pseudomonadota bacterium]MBU2455961.1 4Fe-4S dicluster domain-containing protein [Pseudomonadota bacterium]MBU2627770.1 4Fe-4S dicluster domain-containing protein [Pseudomonadota bacterium]